MMKIKKIYINNFKGIEDKKIIDFSKDITLLTGPNGFGKTTIFDVLELCITGIIHRTEVKSNVTYDRKDYKKPFFQNVKGKDVIIKLWLEKDGQNLIIVKYLNKNHLGCSSGTGTKNKPDDFELFETLKDRADNFENKSFIEMDENLSQNEINIFFDLNTQDVSIQELYRMFNYLQQEETTFFLKKSEKDRKESLGFLFNTLKQENDIENIREYLSKIKLIKNNLEDKINELSLTKFSDEKYIKLFENKNFDFDKKEPYFGRNVEESNKLRDMYLDELKRITDFKDKFSPTEYKKKVKFDMINQIINNKLFLNHYILQDYLLDKNYKIINKQIQIYNNDELLKRVILRNYLFKYEELNRINENIVQYEKFLNMKDFNKKLEILNNFIEDFFNEDKIQDYKANISKIKSEEKLSDDMSKISNDIIRARNELLNNFNSISSELNNSECPFCGSDWKNYKVMIENFNNKTEYFRSLIKVRESNIEKIEKYVSESFFKPVEIKIKEYCKINEKFDVQILDLIKQNNISKEVLEDAISMFDIGKFSWETMKDRKELENEFLKLKNTIKNKLLISEKLFGIVKGLYGKSFDKSLDDLKSVITSEEFSENKCIFSDIERLEVKKLERNRNGIIGLLEKRKELYTYQSDKVVDKENIYKIYFDLDEEKMKIIDDKKMKNKIDYLNFKVNEKKEKIVDKYSKRKRKLEVIIRKIKEVRDIKLNIIINYKRDMIKRIKIPFYIYTSKILQNYQQGMGVFLGTKENSDSIRFYTDNTSDHDAMHHLSSGQLAVVSLAFCLSINKTYNISDNLKFLAIDDPIQEMDSLNIHSFIELIRNEFANDYQLIFSTHHDKHALYMKYKLENFYGDSVKLINVQDVFFN